MICLLETRRSIIEIYLKIVSEKPQNKPQGKQMSQFFNRLMSSDNKQNTLPVNNKRQDNQRRDINWAGDSSFINQKCCVNCRGISSITIFNSSHRKLL